MHSESKCIQYSATNHYKCDDEKSSLAHIPQSNGDCDYAFSHP